MKICNKCKVPKPITDFSTTSSYKGCIKYRGDCKVCNAEEARKRRLDPEIRKRQVESSRKWKQENPEKVASQNRKRNYGITQEQFDAILIAQKNCCAICQSPFSETKKECPHVDHNHETGAVRGLLCHNCNALLGHSKESPSRLISAVQYLQKFLTKTE